MYKLHVDDAQVHLHPRAPNWRGHLSPLPARRALPCPRRRLRVQLGLPCCAARQTGVDVLLQVTSPLDSHFFFLPLPCAASGAGTSMSDSRDYSGVAREVCTGVDDTSLVDFLSCRSTALENSFCRCSGGAAAVIPSSSSSYEPYYE
jgi:hypothetical protein